jgi:fatty acid desaturase
MDYPTEVLKRPISLAGIAVDSQSPQSSQSVTNPFKGNEITALVRDLHQQDGRPGWLRILVYGTLSLSLCIIALVQENLLLFVLVGIVLGFIYSSFMILTHDAIHHTLTGNKIIDEIVPRLMSWPMLWPHGTYSALHKLHHSLNGRDEADPERCHMTTEEYSKASPLKRLVARHQLLFRVLGAGGVGMIVNLLKQTRRIGKRSNAVRRQLLIDVAGILLVNGAMYAIASYYGVALQLFLLWFILERAVGGVQQFRAHLEHYGLWNYYPSFIESQLYNTRNFVTNPFTSFFFNGLNYHSVHHAFPSIPFYHLREAHTRIRDYCTQKNAPLKEEPGYARVALSIIRKPTFVEPMNRMVNSQKA